MKTVGLTGGIGSGKTTVANWFAEKGIPVYNSDYEAKRLMNEDAELKKELIQIFGSKTYIKGEYNRAYVASKVFNDRESLNKLNAVVHPAVFRHFDEWIKKQDAVFIVKEAAILFESGSYKDCDAIISVVADEKIRIDRVVERDGVSRQKVKDRIKNQWTDEQRIEKSDFVIYNNSDLKELKIEFKRVYKELLKRFASS